MKSIWMIPVLASILILGGFGFTQQASAQATFVTPVTPYLSALDIPAGFYAGGSPTFLEDFEDGTLDGGITADRAFGISTGLFTDSVDGDDGMIDGDGTFGHSAFIGGVGAPQSITFTFPSPVVEAGLVWTDGQFFGTTQIFEAFGPGMVSLGTVVTFLGDAVQTGTTGEDTFFGVKDLAGIIAIKMTDFSAGGAFELDHVQYGGPVMPPEEKKSCDALDKASEKGKGKKKGIERAKSNNDC